MFKRNNLCVTLMPIRKQSNFSKSYLFCSLCETDWRGRLSSSAGFKTVQGDHISLRLRISDLCTPENSSQIFENSAYCFSEQAEDFALHSL